MKTFYKILVNLTVLALMHSHSAVAVEVYGKTVCTFNADGEITDTTECVTQPQSQGMRFFKIALCDTDSNKLINGTPTAGQPVINAEEFKKCHVLWESNDKANGSLLELKRGALTNDFKNPNTYIPIAKRSVIGAVYVEMSPTFYTVDSQVFATDRVGTYPAGSLTSGKYCSTRVGPHVGLQFNSPIYSWRVDGGTHVQCDSTKPTPSTTKNFLNALRVEEGVGYADISFYSQQLSPRDGSAVAIKGYLVDASNNLATMTAADSTNEVAKLIGVSAQQMGTFYTWQINAGMDIWLTWNNSYGTTITQNNGETIQVQAFGAGPFDWIVHRSDKYEP